MENDINLKHQLQDIDSAYYNLWDELTASRTNLRVHLSTVVAAFLSIIASLHQTTDNVYQEWCFFMCIVLCVCSLICLVISACENIHNTKNAMKMLDQIREYVTITKTTLTKDAIATPKIRMYDVFFWIGIVKFCLALILFCIINLPLWQ